MKTLLVIIGPTGVGKTEFSLNMADYLHSPIISADSRQIYREMNIGTATPTAEQLERVKHYFINTRSVSEPYSAGQYENDALRLLDDLFLSHDTLLMTGGSMMYVDAVCRGFDDIPTVEMSIREQVRADYEQHGLEFLQEELKRLDPEHYDQVDIKNHQRVMRAVEVCRQTGMTYTELRKGKSNERSFRVVKVGLDRPRAELYDRINLRVEQMIEDGLVEEARSLQPYRSLNALNTVGYKELFDYFDEKCTFEDAVRLIKQDSRHYAKRQLTWFRADKEIRWFNADEIEIQHITRIINKQE